MRKSPPPSRDSHGLTPPRQTQTGTSEIAAPVSGPTAARPGTGGGAAEPTPHSSDTQRPANEKIGRAAPQQRSAIVEESRSSTPQQQGPTQEDPIAVDIRKDITEIKDKNITTQESVRMEQVVLFPEKYVGQKLVFQGCALDGDIVKGAYGTYRLASVRSRNGKFVTFTDDTHFITGATLAANMAEKTQGSSEWFNCTLQCRFLDKSHIFVEAIDVYNAGGSISQRFRN